MASVNKVILIGNLTRDPELRYTPKQTAVTEVGLACNRRYKVDNDLLEKGRSVYVEGRLKLDQWDDKETGKKRSKLSVVGEVCQFLGSRGQGEGPMGGGEDGDAGSSQRFAPQQPQQAAASPPPATGSGPLQDDAEEDDIPF